MIPRRATKVGAALLLAAALFSLDGCAIVYYQQVREKDRIITETGLLGIPEAISNYKPGGLIPLYRSYVPIAPARPGPEE